jgi:virginiamycin A acetyltransferase
VRLSQKLQAFKSSTLKPDRVEGPEGLAAAGISGMANRTRHLLVEHGVSLHSDAITSAGRESFIGAHSYMNPGGYMRERVFIGRYCSIGRRVSIGAGAHVMTGVSTHPALAGDKSRRYDNAERHRLWPDAVAAAMPRPDWTVLGNDVWVGDGAIIIPGIAVGTGAVIGANSVVTRDVPPYSIVAGSPAAVTRLRFPNDIISCLLESDYWDLPLSVLKSLPMRHVLDFLDALRVCNAAIEPYLTLQLVPQHGDL